MSTRNKENLQGQTRTRSRKGGNDSNVSRFSSKTKTRKHKQALRMHKSSHVGVKSFSRDDRSSFLRHRSGNVLQTGGSVIFAQQTSDSVLGGVAESKVREDRSISDILQDVTGEDDSIAVREAQLKSAYAIAVEEARAHQKVIDMMQKELVTASDQNRELEQKVTARDRRVEDIEEAVATLKGESVRFETSSDDLSVKVKVSMSKHLYEHNKKRLLRTSL